jgi:arylsulfatase
MAPGLLRGVAVQPAAAGAAARPGIIMIMADDVDHRNLGAYSHGMMVPTPNLDRLVREGMLFTDHYAEPTSKPGRAAFISGQMPIRTGLPNED